MRFRLIVPPLALSAAVALSVGCSTSDPSDPRSYDVGARPESAAAGRIAFDDELGGRPVVDETSGPWQMRKSGSRLVAAGADMAVGARSKSRAIGVGGGLGGPTTGGGGGGAPPPGAPAPSGDPASEPVAESLDAGDASSADAPFEGGEALHFEVDGDARARREVGPAKPRIRPAGSAAPAQRLRAGATDDNADFAAYLEFLATWVDKKEIQELYHPLDVTDRRHVRVVDADGAPVPGAVVSVVDVEADRVLWTATTYGDGRVPFYPNLDAMPVGTGGDLVIEAYLHDDAGGGIGARAEWDGAGIEIEIALSESVGAPDPVQLDVCFVIDTTGSMGDEIASIKASLLRVTEKLRGLEREFDLRYSAVLYRDIGDEYVTATHAFTADIEAFDEALRGVQAAGGGDGPESLNQAVAQAVDGVDWRPGAAKVAFLIADAPPHMDYAGDVSYGDSVRAAVAKGIRFHSVAASGLDPVGTLVFRQIAQFTRGKFIFIEYGTPAASAASHGVGGEVKSDNLEDILFAQLRDEVATYGRGD